MDTYLSLLPQELILEVFVQLSTSADMKNFILATETEALFSNGNTFKILFASSFPGIDLTVVTSIDYTIKDYIYYVFLYIDLNKAYYRALDRIEIIQNRAKYKIDQYYSKMGRAPPDLNSDEDYPEELYIILSNRIGGGIHTKMIVKRDIIYKFYPDEEYLLDQLPDTGNEINLDIWPDGYYKLYLYMYNGTDNVFEQFSSKEVSKQIAIQFFMCKLY